MTPVAGDAGLDQREQRRLAAWPDIEFSRHGIHQLPRQLETWFNDHFGLRSKLVSLHDRLEFELLGSSGRVLVGEGGWLFLKRGIRTDIEMIPIVKDLCGETPFTQTQLDYWASTLERNANELASRGIDYLLVKTMNPLSLFIIRPTPTGTVAVFRQDTPRLHRFWMT